MGSVIVTFFVAGVRRVRDAVRRWRSRGIDVGPVSRSWIHERKQHRALRGLAED